LYDELYEGLYNKVLSSLQIEALPTGCAVTCSCAFSARSASTSASSPTWESTLLYSL
jgi:hypothetical protein